MVERQKKKVAHPMKTVHSIAIPFMEFQVQGYKIRMIFA
jgi:hypothetical protein